MKKKKGWRQPRGWGCLYENIDLKEFIFLIAEAARAEGCGSLISGWMR
jgi:hypothetical protein